MPDVPNLNDWLGVGINATLLGALVTSWRLFFTELRRDRDYWRTMALRGTALAEKATDAATTSG